MVHYLKYHLHILLISVSLTIIAVYSISINGILDCKRSDNELQPVIATGTKNEEGVPLKTLTVLLISFVMFVLSFILRIVGLFSRVLPLMILSAFIISMLQSLYIFSTIKNRIALFIQNLSL